ncbi:MAG TPA: AAA family ATPase [Bryobacteraceae bacterium]
MPVLTVFGGPNGSGKSSIIERVAFEGKHNLLDSDAIAKRLNPNNPGQSAIAAARDVLRRTHAYIEAGQSFAVETTLAGSWILTAMQAALQQGWMVRVVYICVDTPERNIRRVRERVLQGGHDVPDEDIRRRYARSLQNIQAALKIVGQCTVYDNSGAEPRKVLETRAGVIVWQAVDQPSWVTSLIKNLS